MPTTTQQLTTAVLDWPGTAVRIGTRDEYGFYAGARELRHLHGDRVAHFGFPRALGTALREAGRVGPHPVNPHSPKLAARELRGQEDVAEVLALLRLNYEGDVRATVAAIDAAHDDVDGFCALLAEDVTIVNFAGRRIEGREAMRRAMTAALEGELARIRTRLEVESVAVPADGVAVVRATKTVLDERESSGALPGTAAVTISLVRQAGGWRVAAMQTTLAPSVASREDDVTAIEAVIALVEAGMNGNDAVLATRDFADDAFAVDVRGREVEGAAALLAAHERAFAGPLADQYARYDIAGLRFLADDVALVRSHATATDQDGEPLDVGHAMVALYALVRARDGRWRIAARQNTLVDAG